MGKYLRAAGLMGLAGLNAAVHAANPTVAWPLKVDASGRLLVDQNGVPFPIIGDTAWHMQVNLSPAEMDVYFADRDARGINTINVMAMNKCDLVGSEARDNMDAGNPGNIPDDYNGNKPFTNNHAWSTSKVAAYWATIDLILQKAEEHNMLVLFAPAYLGYQCGTNNEGWCKDEIAQTNADMTAWGNWIAARYQGQKNIIWIDGGDSTASNSVNPGSMDRVAALRDALYATAPSILHTSHPGSQDMGADVYPWIQVFELYNEKSYSTGWSLVAPRARYLYFKLGPDGKHHPIFQIEGIYETQVSSTPKVWAGQFMYAALGGGIGGLYGNSYVNRFWRTDFHPCDWTGPCGVGSPGSKQQTNLGLLYRSRAWWRFVPDYDHTVVTAGYGQFQSPVWPYRNAPADSTYVAVARTSDGETVMTWHPVTTPITMDMSKISGIAATCWWFSPADGTARAIGTFPTSGTKTFTPAATNRVLVCDDAAKGLGPPGTAAYPYYPQTNGESPPGVALLTCLAPLGSAGRTPPSACDPSAGECRCTDLTWNPVAGATRYEVERETVDAGTRVLAGTIVPHVVDEDTGTTVLATVWSAARDGMFPKEASLYRYYVRACDASGCGAWATSPDNRAWAYSCFDGGIEVSCYPGAPMRTRP